MSAPVGETKTTLRQHLEQVWKTSGIMPDELKEPEIPFDIEHVWEWFCELNAARGSNGLAIMPISYVELKAWSELTGIDPTPYEISIIRSLDNLYLQSR